MCANQYVRTWTTNELYYAYCDLGGTLSRQQILSNLTTHLGNDVVVVRVECCDDVVGFKELLGKSLKLVKVDRADEDSVYAVIRLVS